VPLAGGAVTASAAVTVTLLYVAEMITGVLAVTTDVVMVNVGDTDAPPATVTDAGTVAAGLLLVNVTTAPPPGAAPFKLTVAVVETPPRTDADVNVTVEAMSGPIVKFPGTVTPL